MLTAVARRGLPGIVDTSLAPAAIFLIVTAAFAAPTAMVAVLVWGLGTILRRMLCGAASLLFSAAAITITVGRAFDTAHQEQLIFRTS